MSGTGDFDPGSSTAGGPALSQDDLVLVAELINITNQQVIPKVFETVFFGILTLMVAFCVLILIRTANSKSQRFLLFVIVSMYLISTLEWAIDILLLWLDLQLGPQILVTGNPEAGALPDSTVALDSLDIIATVLNLVVGDMIVLWRACVIHFWRRNFLIPSAILVVPVFVNWTLACINSVRVVAFSLPPFKHITTITILAYSSSLLLNVWATCSIALVAWQHRKRFYAFFSGERKGGLLGGVLALIIESGLIFIIIWFIYFSAAFNLFGFTPSQGITDVMVMVIPLYPVSVVILVALHKAPGQSLQGEITSSAYQDPDKRRVLSGMITQADTKNTSVMPIGESFDSGILNTVYSRGYAGEKEDAGLMA